MGERISLEYYDTDTPGDEACLDGWFTPNELRKIADEKDNKIIAKEMENNATSE